MTTANKLLSITILALLILLALTSHDKQVLSDKVKDLSSYNAVQCNYYFEDKNSVTDIDCYYTDKSKLEKLMTNKAYNRELLK